MEKKTMQALVTFLKLYVQFSKPDTLATFKTAIHSFTENKMTMTIEELLLSRAEQKGIKREKQRGKQR